MRPLWFAWCVDRMVSRGGFDIVHAHERVFRADVVSMHSVPHAGWIKSVRRKRPGLFDLATIYVEKRMMENRGCFFLPVSTLASDALTGDFPVVPSAIRVAHPGVDAERFSSPDRTACRKEIRSRYGIGSSETLALFVGMNFEVKGLDVIMASVARASERLAGGGLRLLVVGKGEIPKYEALARKLRIRDLVIFAGRQAEGMERYYSASDFFMMLSKFDTFGMAVLEAMAAGLPVVISGGVGAKDLVRNGVNGYVVEDPCDSASAAEKIEYLMDEGARERMGREAQRTARENSWDRLADTVEEIYERIGRPPGR